MTSKRIQLTLFVAQNESNEMEQVRREFNPEQHGLIKAHVTLCREDELEQIERIVLNLRNLDLGGIMVNLGRPVRFSDGKGVLIPAIGDNTAFQKLRETVLRGAIEAPRAHEPHITLMHPRNSTCTDEIFGQIELHSFPSQVKFTKISLIEQEMGQQWKVLAEFELRHYQPHKPSSTSSTHTHHAMDKTRANF